MDFIKNRKENISLSHLSFEILLFLKFLVSVAEILAGTFLAMPFFQSFQNFLLNFLSKELIEDSDDIITALAYRFISGYSSDMNSFMIFYLLSHGIVKLIIIYFLYKKKVWAYPVAIAVFTAFIIYQVYKYIYMHSFILIIATIVDIVLTILTVKEYIIRKKTLNKEEVQL